MAQISIAYPNKEILAYIDKISKQNKWSRSVTINDILEKHHEREKRKKN